jgi:hypothetical protein
MAAAGEYENRIGWCSPVTVNKLIEQGGLSAEYRAPDSVDFQKSMAGNNIQKRAYTPSPLAANGFNPKVKLPHGLRSEHIGRTMMDFLEFLGFVNHALRAKKIQRLESFLMPANFSSIVGEFMTATIPKYCKALVKITITTDTQTLSPRVPSRRTPVCTATRELKLRPRVTRADGKGIIRKTSGSWCSCLKVTARGTLS